MMSKRNKSILFIFCFIGSFLLITPYLFAQQEHPNESDVYIPVVGTMAKFPWMGGSIGQMGVAPATLILHNNCIQLQVEDGTIHPTYWYDAVTLDDETNHIYNEYGHYKAIIGDVTQNYTYPHLITPLRLSASTLAEIKEQCGSDDVFIMIGGLKEDGRLDMHRIANEKRKQELGISR